MEDESEKISKELNDAFTKLDDELFGASGELERRLEQATLEATIVGGFLVHYDRLPTEEEFEELKKKCLPEAKK